MKFLKNKIISSIFLFVFLVSCSSSEPREAKVSKDIVNEEVITREQSSKPIEEISTEKPAIEEKVEPAKDTHTSKSDASEKKVVPTEEEISKEKEVIIPGEDTSSQERVKEDEISDSKETEDKTEEKPKEIVIDNSFFAEKVDSIFSERGLNSSHYGIKVVNLSSGETIFERNEDSSFIPASNTKLYTGAAAMEILGKDYRFKTRLAYRGEISPDGTLNGDLYIIGGGDPTLGSKYLFNRRFNMQSKATPGRIDTQLAFLDEWADEVKSLGINRVNGKVLVDDSHFNKINTAINTWEWRDMSTSFGAPPSGVNILDNIVLVDFSRDGGTNITPSTSTVEVINDTTNSKANKVTVSAPPYGKSIVAVGEVYTSVSKEVPVPDPGLLLGDLFRKNLEKNGISINNGFEVVQTSSHSKVFFTHYSPSLERISVLMNSYSINLYAETLKLEAEKELAKTRPISISRYWYETLNLQGFRLYDGSGLSRYSRVTPNNTIELLSYMYSSEYAEDYYGSLAVAGQRGTFQDFNKPPLRNNLHGKSGTLTGVKSYSGYITNSNDELLAFSIMVNLHGLTNYQITAKLEEIMSEMYKLQ
ncbi:hypothetical protein PM10SUCC1_16490 [Propionigenium maris DSM 9537]|uniref:D-alanyl-D-alanine carboxypeptidase / D-alanyl-D-alanine-endopeptidase (Penicillin-binding protein 4) n=1 Tax=Propionigenium maris DSM 9537 TaxID=1123000 RepID=A0A9W6LNP1_9FUSO|nr:D-alanyl-D-alanine carboxypeptidase/D-alanyl-D-alanine-endopeptidase [Propionigenium maris]GLI56135.1 hypothetical protein PM10SUCC1_16490 [Propionigenium maris DSM 9537]